MFNNEKIESLDHKKLPKAYTPEELKRLNDAREADRKAKAAGAGGQEAESSEN